MSCEEWMKGLSYLTRPGLASKHRWSRGWSKGWDLSHGTSFLLTRTPAKHGRGGVSTSGTSGCCRSSCGQPPSSCEGRMPLLLRHPVWRLHFQPHPHRGAQEAEWGAFLGRDYRAQLPQQVVEKGLKWAAPQTTNTSQGTLGTDCPLPTQSPLG